MRGGRDARVGERDYGDSGSRASSAKPVFQRLNSLRKKSNGLPFQVARHRQVSSFQHRQDCLCHQNRASVDFFRKL